MNSLQSLLSAQAPTLDTLEQSLPEEAAFCPPSGPIDRDADWAEEAETATDRAIFGQMVAGG